MDTGHTAGPHTPAEGTAAGCRSHSHSQRSPRPHMLARPATHPRREAASGNIYRPTPHMPMFAKLCWKAWWVGWVVDPLTWEVGGGRAVDSLPSTMASPRENFHLKYKKNRKYGILYESAAVEGRGGDNTNKGGLVVNSAPKASGVGTQTRFGVCVCLVLKKHKTHTCTKNVFAYPPPCFGGPVDDNTPGQLIGGHTPSAADQSLGHYFRTRV